jgi:hypothetical protein
MDPIGSLQAANPVVPVPPTGDDPIVSTVPPSPEVTSVSVCFAPRGKSCEVSPPVSRIGSGCYVSPARALLGLPRG